ncbi:MAG: hypothetical protein IIW48_12020, partial [Clostridia bacterium]|nr:hypothetical protein [Clostridia bacterium]
MKKIIYSTALKFTAVLLFVLSLTLGTLFAANGFVDYSSEDEHIYTFESDFSQSHDISNLLNEPVMRMLSVYRVAFNEYDVYGRPVVNDEVDAEKIKGIINQWFSYFADAEKINYFVQWNDMVVTNCGAQSSDEVAGSGCYLFFKRYDNGRIEYDSSEPKNRLPYLYSFEDYNDKNTIVISCNVKEEVVDTYKALW